MHYSIRPAALAFACCCPCVQPRARLQIAVFPPPIRISRRVRTGTRQWLKSPAMLPSFDRRVQQAFLAVLRRQKYESRSRTGLRASALTQGPSLSSSATDEQRGPFDENRRSKAKVEHDPQMCATFPWFEIRELPVKDHYRP